MKRLILTLLLIGTVFAVLAIPFDIPKVEAFTVVYRVPFVSQDSNHHHTNSITSLHPGASYGPGPPVYAPNTYVAWGNGNAYVVGNTISGTNGRAFVCILNHVSAAADKPTSGANWRTYWKALDSGWPMPCAGIWSELRVQLEAAIGGGRTLTYTLYVDEMPSALTVTFNDADVQKTDLANEVAVSAGQTVRLVHTATGTDTTFYPQHSMTFEPTTPGIQPFFGGFQLATYQDQGLQWAGINGGASVSSDYPGADANSELSASQVMPTPGTFKYLYCELNGNAEHELSGTDNVDYIFRVNNTDTPLGFSFSAPLHVGEAGTEQSDLTTEVHVDTGDIVDFKMYCYPSVGHTVHPTIIHSICFIPDEPQYWFLTRTVGFTEDFAGNKFTDGLPEYSPINLGNATSTDYWFASENTSHALQSNGIMPPNMTIYGITVWLDTAPGAGKSRTVTLRLNGNDTAVTTTISDTDNWSTAGGFSVTVDEWDSLKLCNSRTGLAVATRGTIALLGTEEMNAPAVSTKPATGITVSSGFMNGTLDDLGGAPDADVYFYWGSVSGIYTDNALVSTLSTLDDFTLELTGLAASETVYYIAYAVTFGGDDWGIEMSFTTHTIDAMYEIWGSATGGWELGLVKLLLLTLIILWIFAMIAVYRSGSSSDY